MILEQFNNLEQFNDTERVIIRIIPMNWIK